MAPLGALHLHLNRLKALADAGSAIHAAVPPRDTGPFDRIPDRVNDYLAEKGAKPPETAHDVDSGYRQEVARALRKVIWDLRKSRDPNSPHWKAGLPVFVAGGGGRLSILRDAIRRAESDIRGASQDVSAFRYIGNAAHDDGPDAPPSDDSQDDEGPPAAVQARLEVAYGLSLIDDLESITPPARIGDVKPSPPKPRPSRPDYWAGKGAH